MKVVHRFLNVNTNKIIISRDFIWLNKVYGIWKGLPVKVTRMSKEESDSEEDEEVIMKRRDNLKNEVGRERNTKNENIWLPEGQDNVACKEVAQDEIPVEGSTPNVGPHSESTRERQNAILRARMGELSCSYNEEATKLYNQLSTPVNTPRKL